MLTAICLRRPKDAIQLPPRTDKVHRVEFEADEAGHYNKMSDLVTADLQHDAGQTHLKTCANVLAKINSLRQICNLGTYYQTTKRQSTGPQAQMAAMQESFDGMLSAAAAVCSKCDIDVAQDDSDFLGPPRLATCGQLICASCAALSKTHMGADHIGCTRQASCKLFIVEISGSKTALPPATVAYLPVKMRALQKDLSALPVNEKRQVKHLEHGCHFPESYILASIVFSFWTTTLDLVCTALKEIGLLYTRVDGTMTVRERQHSLTSFTDEPRIRVILISLRCGSTGYTMF